MYFWDIESLKEDIRRGEFTDKELMPYIVLSVVLYILGTEFTAYFPYENINIWTYLLSILNILIPLGGTLYVYKKNGGAKGNNFASKYISIGLVVGFRFLVYLVLVIMLLIIYWYFSFGEQEEEMPTTFVEVALSSSWYVLLYYQIAKHTEETNTIPATTDDRKPKNIYFKILKWFFVGIFLLIVSIILYLAIEYYSVPDDLNKEEANKVLNKQLDIYCKKPYSELTTLIESESTYIQIEADSGTNYQIEIQAYKENNNSDILLFGTIDNGNRSAYHPMVDTVVKKITEECVRE